MIRTCISFRHIHGIRYVNVWDIKVQLYVYEKFLVKKEHALYKVLAQNSSSLVCNGVNWERKSSFASFILSVQEWATHTMKNKSKQNTLVDVFEHTQKFGNAKKKIIVCFLWPSSWSWKRRHLCTELHSSTIYCIL